jgi:hypothetical protein
MILRNLSAAADWKFAARAMDLQMGSFSFLCDLLADIGFEVIQDEYDSYAALIFAPGISPPVGTVYGASVATVSFDDSSIWEEAEEVCIPCPEPSPVLTAAQSMKAHVNDQATGDHGWRRGLEEAARGGGLRGPWSGFTPWGLAYQAGIEYGLQFTL